MQENEPISGQEDVANADACFLVRLLSECISMNGDLIRKRRHCLESFSAYVDANYWGWGHAAIEDGKAPMPVGFMGNFTEEMNQLAVQAMVDPANRDPMMPHFATLMQDNPHVTIRNGDVIEQADWVNSGYHRVYIAELGLDQRMTSVSVVQPDLLSITMLHRKNGRGPFSRAQRNLFHILTAEAQWLHHRKLPSDGGTSVDVLSPRLHETLIFVLNGDDNRQIARKMDISEHTVKDYVKQLQSRYRVQNKRELIANFLAGMSDL